MAWSHRRAKHDEVADSAQSTNSAGKLDQNHLTAGLRPPRKGAAGLSKFVALLGSILFGLALVGSVLSIAANIKGKLLCKAFTETATFPY